MLRRTPVASLIMSQKCHRTNPLSRVRSWVGLTRSLAGIRTAEIGATPPPRMLQQGSADGSETGRSGRSLGLLLVPQSRLSTAYQPPPYAAKV